MTLLLPSRTLIVPRMPLGVARGVVTTRPTTVDSLTREVAASNDDANENISTTSVATGGASLTIRDARLHLLRFTNITVPQGATINTATIQVTSADTFSGTNGTQIWCEDADNAATCSGSDGDITGRTKTTASSTFAFPAWSFDERSDDTKTPNLASVVQEVIDRVGWSSGNAIVFLVGATTGSSGDRDYWTFDGEVAGQRPELFLEWQT